MTRAHTASSRTTHIVEKFQGFDTHRLANAGVELIVVPELGAKIISLKNRKTGREWLWRPDGALKLFSNRIGDDFSTSPLVGVDECLPTIAPCAWRGRALPDHGEVWAASWTADTSRASEGIFSTGIRLALTPFLFCRTIELDSNRIILRYQLKNLGAQEEPYLWAIHPLLRLQNGDHLELPASTRALLDSGAAWVDAVDTVIPEGGCSKIFARSVKDGRAAIVNRNTGERFEFAWSVSENDSLGIWLTRGGWHGYHHFAIEPTNGSPDPLATAIEQKHHGKVAASGTATWSVSLQLTA